MKVIGVVGRAYYNRDGQKIFQINEDIRRVLSRYDDVVSVMLLPTDSCYYTDINMGEDEVDKNKIDYILDMCDGFIIPGGSSWYNFDEYVIKYACDKDKSLLAICAGFQCLCSMYACNRNRFDMTSRVRNDSHHGDDGKYMHKNSIIDNTKLKKILGCNDIMVNSVHNDYVDFKMNNLIISSYSEDGVIEAVEMCDKSFIIGVQWHPEYLMDDSSIKIFDNFIDSIK